MQMAIKLPTPHLRRRKLELHLQLPRQQAVDLPPPVDIAPPQLLDLLIQERELLFLLGCLALGSPVRFLQAAL